MIRLMVPYGTSTYVQYSKDATEQVIAGVGTPVVCYKGITVTFSGPVLSGKTGKAFEHASSVTLERANGLRIWSVSLGTPIDSYETYRDVFEEEIPEVIRTAVNTFIEAFEK